MSHTLPFASLRAVLFDMDGVLYRGSQLLPGVRELIAFLDQQDIGYACVTNNATKTQQQYCDKLASLNIPIPAARVVTSARATGHYLRNHYPRGTRVYPIGMVGLTEALFHDGYFLYDEEQPELVVQGADFDLTYAKLRRGCLAIRAGARFIATNSDRTFPSEEGLVPGAGSILAALQAASDAEPLIVGKPQPYMFESAVAMLETNPASTLMIGDRLDTDIAGARAAGMPSALVLTGVTNRAQLDDLADPSAQPDAVFDDLTALLAAWQQVL
jgi:4-nitrophenyl phosphatase